MSRWRVFVVAAFAACGGQPEDQGLDEPVRARGGQFVDGDLPGTPPGTPSPFAKITNVTASSRIVRPGEAGKGFDGRATDNAASVAVRLADLGSGYWVFLLTGRDAQFPGELGWHVDLDFDSDFAASPGFHPLRFVAVDPNGNAGEQNETSICLLPKTPDNGHTCDTTIAPPDAVISLAWDTDVDLDLLVVTPDLVTVEPKKPTSAVDDAGTPAPGSAQIDRDSLAGCVRDGRRQEDIVWQTRPKGTFDVYANLFDACRQQAVRFVATVWEAQGVMPNRNLVPTQTSKGVLTAIDANGGSAIGQYLFSYSF